jgi:hypothetical protein
MPMTLRLRRPWLPIAAVAMTLCAEPAWAQSPPRIGLIEFYGLRKVSEARVRQTMGVKEGDMLPRSKGDTEERLDALPGVVETHLEAVCCEGNQAILFVGVEERGAPHFEIREPPEDDVPMPKEITDTYRRFLEAFQTAARRGVTAEDLTHGHSLSADPSTRAIQEMFSALADDNLVVLRNVLRNSGDEEQRATAAYVIGYATRKRDIVNDLQYALRDADSGVRVNAGRNLLALAVLARLSPNSGVMVSPTWFIEMLNSLSWTDRNRAAKALQILTDTRDASVIGQMRDRALDALTEMARWKSLENALPAFVLVGRIVGLTDQEIQDKWTSGQREAVIALAAGKKAK